MDEHDDDDQHQLKSPMKLSRLGSTRKIYLFNSEYENNNSTFRYANDDP